MWSSVLNADNDSLKTSKNGLSQGTGWVLKGGYVITNQHVIGSHNEVLLVDNQEKIFSAKPIFLDKHNDIAILKPETSFSKEGLVLNTSRPKLGKPVFTIGYPLTEIMGKNQKFSAGTISSISGIQDDPRFFQTSLPLHSGNSGGPLFGFTPITRTLS